MKDKQNDEVRTAVRQTYRQVAQATSSCGCAPSCCAATPNGAIVSISAEKLGYTQNDASSVPEGTDMGLGCGNPQAIAVLRAGETVLDLGSGGGFDAFLAARQIGEGGHVIGVDMTPEMLSKARANTIKGGYRNVEFRLGEIENLPVADHSVDVIISNCVINLSPDKRRVFREAWRVLKPGGRLAISDVVAFADLPETVRSDLALHTGCMAGASTVPEVEAMLRECGFSEVRVTPKGESMSFIRDWAPGMDVSDYVVSASIEAIKPFS